MHGVYSDSEKEGPGDDLLPLSPRLLILSTPDFSGQPASPLLTVPIRYETEFNQIQQQDMLFSIGFGILKYHVTAVLAGMSKNTGPLNLENKI